MRTRTRIAGIITVVFFLSVQGAWAAPTSEELLQRLNDLSDLIQKQQQEIEKLRQELQQQKKSMDAAQEVQKKELEKAVKAEVKAQEKTWSDYVPKWVKQTKLSGDLRLRYEGTFNMDKMETNGSKSDVPDRNQYRLRARLFVDSKISEEITTQFMISTNQDANREATTTNQTFGEYFNDKGIYLHRAFASYKPLWLKGLEITGGKFKNTFVHTDIMWDPDVNQEGIYERYQYDGWESFRPFVHLGQMSVNEIRLETDDPYLFINQAGFEWKLGPVKWTLVGSYYDWTNLKTTGVSPTNTAALHKGGGGNTFVNQAGFLVFAYDYDLVEGITFVEFPLGPVPVELIFDYIVNIADGVPGDQDTAYYAGFNLGKKKKKGDWDLLYKYAWIERDSLVGSLNDQDFYGANRKGHKVRIAYLLHDKVEFGTAYFYTDPIKAWNPSEPLWALDRFRGHEDRLQLDFIFKF